MYCDKTHRNLVYNLQIRYKTKLTPEASLSRGIRGKIFCTVRELLPYEFMSWYGSFYKTLLDSLIFIGWRIENTKKE